MNNSFVIKGDIAFSENQNEIKTFKDGYLVCVNNLCKGAFATLPEEYASLPLHDYSGRLVVPGMTDLHVHAPQLPLLLMEWIWKLMLLITLIF